MKRFCYLDMELKTEKSICEFLKTLPDDAIIKYYLEVEYSPFPILIIQEYTRRFKQKTKDEILKKLKVQAKLAKRKAKEISHKAKRKQLVDDVTRQKTDEVLAQAKKKGFEISEILSKKGSVLGSKVRKKASSGVKKGVQVSKSLKYSTQKDLDLLEKLGALRKAGIITEKEFKEKKNKILAKI